jgi:hypothetical protein
MTEEWRPIFGGSYSVSSAGRVRRETPGRRTSAGKLLALTKMKIGYLSFAPVVNGKNRTTYIHAVVAEAFLGPRPSGHEINHIDGDKTHNDRSNLEYVSHAANMAHAARIGLMVAGERHPACRISNVMMMEIRAARRAGEKGVIVAKRYGVSQAMVSQIFTGKRRTRG